MGSTGATECTSAATEFTSWKKTYPGGSTDQRAFKYACTAGSATTFSKSGLISEYAVSAIRTIIIRPYTTIK